MSLHFRRRLIKASLPACVAALSVSLVWRAHGAPPSLEYEVKAAFLLNFTKFIEWPASTFADGGSPFTICILGKDPFGKLLDSVVEGEMVDGHKLAVRKISEPPVAHSCQIVFVEGSEKELRRRLGNAGPGVLTVGEGENFIREGGMIGFVIDQNRVRFDINRAAAESAGLKLSSKLLSVARVVDN